MWTAKKCRLKEGIEWSVIVDVVRVEIVQESLIIYPSDCGCRRAWLSLSNDAIHFFPRSGHPAHKLFPVGCANEVANVARSLIVKWHCGVLDPDRLSWSSAQVSSDVGSILPVLSRTIPAFASELAD